MKTRILILIFFSLLAANFCKKDNVEISTGTDCGKLLHGIYYAVPYSTVSNDSLIKVEIDKLTKDLTPKPTTTDRHGQLANFDTLFKRLDKCNKISFQICCYCCIQTGIPQTEVLVIADSNGVQIKRIFDFWSGYQMNLTFGQAHGYYGGCKK